MSLCKYVTNNSCLQADLRRIFDPNSTLVSCTQYSQQGTAQWDIYGGQADKLGYTFLICPHDIP